MATENIPKEAKKPSLSSRKKILYLVIGVCLSGILITIVAALLNSGEPTQKTADRSACAILKPETAKKILSAEKVSKNTSLGKLKPSDDVEITKCSYRPKDGLGNNYEVSLIVRAPKNGDGEKANKQHFKQPKYPSADKFKLSEKYGDANTWNDNEGQLDILKHKNWYTLSYGPVGASGGTDKKLSEAQKAVKEIQSKL